MNSIETKLYNRIKLKLENDLQDVSIEDYPLDNISDYSPIDHAEILIKMTGRRGGRELYIGNDVVELPRERVEIYGCSLTLIVKEFEHSTQIYDLTNQIEEAMFNIDDLSTYKDVPTKQEINEYDELFDLHRPFLVTNVAEHFYNENGGFWFRVLRFEKQTIKVYE